jgi:hypothetical protein
MIWMLCIPYLLTAACAVLLSAAAMAAAADSMKKDTFSNRSMLISYISLSFFLTVVTSEM